MNAIPNPTRIAAPPGGDQQRRRPARDRIDLTQVADPVGLKQEEEISDVNGDGEQKKGPALGSRRRYEGQDRERQHRGGDRCRRQNVSAARLANTNGIGTKLVSAPIRTG